MLTPQLSNFEKTGECEVCDKTEVHITRHYGNMWFCDECWVKEQELTKNNSTPEAQAQRVETYKMSVQTSRELDNAVQVRTDLFNAATESIVNLKKMIDENAEIPNKPYALATELLERFNHFKSVIFEYNEKIVEANNEQKAIQIYLNQMANTLRADEREKLKIADINYKPNPVKTVTPRGIKTSGTSKKIDKSAVKKLAAELGVSEFTVQMIVVQNGGDVEKAGNILRKSIKEAQSMK